MVGRVHLQQHHHLWR